ncbi:MAG: ankyrin repeat domain-containing protein [Puniceicoccales bacterium]|jgi:hypothetical protein|nr:ankyrin repeat domain-containing protein [Puniceicoccales bacterium]
MLIKVNKKIINTLIVNSLFLGGFVGSLSQFNAFGGISDVSTEDYDVHDKNLPKPEDELRKLLNAPLFKINWEEVNKIISANPKLLTMQNSDRQTALHLAVLRESDHILKALIAQLSKNNMNNMKACLKVQDRYGRTPLHLAVWLNNVDMVKALIAQLSKDDVEACLKVRDDEGQTPLNLAEEPRNREMIKAFRKQFDDVDDKYLRGHFNAIVDDIVNECEDKIISPDEAVTQLKQLRERGRALGIVASAVTPALMKVERLR